MKFQFDQKDIRDFERKEGWKCFWQAMAIAIVAVFIMAMGVLAIPHVL